eukprot:403339649
MSQQQSHQDISKSQQQNKSQQQHPSKLEDLSKEDLIKILHTQLEQRQQLKQSLSKAKENSANLSQMVKSEEEYIANKLMTRLSALQLEKESLVKKVKKEEDFLQQNLRKKLKKLQQQKVDMENQLEQEQEQIVNKLSKQLTDAITEKNMLFKKLDQEKRTKDELMIKIQQEEKTLKQILQERVERLQREKADINFNKEMESEYKINKLNNLMSNLVKEKQKLEEFLCFEVQSKQELVLALAKEKKNLTDELVTLIKEIRKSKHKIKKHVGSEHIRRHYQGYAQSSNQSQNIQTNSSASSNESSPRFNKRSASASLFSAANYNSGQTPIHHHHQGANELRNSVQQLKSNINLDSSILSSQSQQDIIMRSSIGGGQNNAQNMNLEQLLASTSVTSSLVLNQSGVQQIAGELGQQYQSNLVQNQINSARSGDMISQGGNKQADNISMVSGGVIGSAVGGNNDDSVNLGEDVLSRDQFTVSEINQQEQDNLLSGQQEFNFLSSHQLQQEILGTEQNIDLMKILEEKDDLLAMLQRDKDFYEGQDKKMRVKIGSIVKQLDEAQSELIKYKRLCDEINNNKLQPFEIQRIAGSLGIMAQGSGTTLLSEMKSNDYLSSMGMRQNQMLASGQPFDSSMEMDQYSMTDSSSYISNESSFSLDSKERSCSNDLRKSFDSNSNDFMYRNHYGNIGYGGGIYGGSAVAGVSGVTRNNPSKGSFDMMGGGGGSVNSGSGVTGTGHVINAGGNAITTPHKGSNNQKKQNERDSSRY